MDAAPHARLLATLAAAEAALQALLAECRQPDVVAALEVRAHARLRRATHRDGAATHAARFTSAHATRAGLDPVLTGRLPPGT